MKMLVPLACAFDIRLWYESFMPMDLSFYEDGL